MIPYGRQALDEDDIEAVVRVLRSDYLTQGPVVAEFESAVAAYCGVPFAIAVNSATSGLHLACLALGVNQESLVWTSPISFVASSNCALYCGASVDFVDIDVNDGCMSVRALRQKLENAQRLGQRLPDVVIPVHFAGQPCDMAGIHALAVEYGFRIIEDAAHAIGSSYEGRRTGSCAYADICVFSFHPVKVMTSGEGGLVSTQNETLAERIRLLSSHGVTRDKHLMTGKPNGAWAYHQIDLGFNYRMSDIHAALGLSQLAKLDRFVAERNAIAQHYQRAFGDIGLATLSVRANCYSAYHLFQILLPEAVSREAVFLHLREQGVGANVHYIPIYKQPYYQRLGFAYDYCPNAESFYGRVVTLPMFPSLKTKEIDQVIDTVRQVLISTSAVVRDNTKGD